VITDSSDREAYRQVAVRAANEVACRHLPAGAPHGGMLRISCECGDPRCDTTLHTPRETYEVVRGVGSRFLIVDTHENPEMSRVVTVGAGYAIVETIGRDARRIVLRGHDPPVGHAPTVPAADGGPT